VGNQVNQGFSNKLKTYIWETIGITKVSINIGQGIFSLRPYQNANFSRSKGTL